jgi:membrane protein implicated in regulation of membrane protease activity
VPVGLCQQTFDSLFAIWIAQYVVFILFLVVLVLLSVTFTRSRATTTTSSGHSELLTSSRGMLQESGDDGTTGIEFKNLNASEGKDRDEIMIGDDDGEGEEAIDASSCFCNLSLIFFL